MSKSCDCCSGVGRLTPVSTVNRPGLGALQYRSGTHASFLQTMKARLSTLELSPDDFEETVPRSIPELRPILALTTREASDPAIALLDAWALVADVLTFYQERIANEGFLGTATERRSVLELARLIGYRLRPGVAASVHLAYTLEKDSQVVIPKGSRAQSVPGPGELPQSFETSADLEARTEWNRFTPRATRPQKITIESSELYFEGVSTRLKVNDPLLLVFDGEGKQSLRRVQSVEPDTAANRTKVVLVGGSSASDTSAFSTAGLTTSAAATTSSTSNKPATLLLAALEQLPSTPPAGSLRLDRSVATAFAATADGGAKLLRTLRPALSASYYDALAAFEIAVTPPVQVFALRVTAPLFGYNATATRPPELPAMQTRPPQDDQWHVVEPVYDQGLDTIEDQRVHEKKDVINLDASYEAILEDSWVVVDAGETALTPEGSTVIAKAGAVKASVGRGVYGLAGKSTEIHLVSPADGTAVPWLTQALTLFPSSSNQTGTLIAGDFDAIRATVVYAQSELLPLAEKPIDPVAEPIAGDSIELADLVSGLESGRWLLVRGERVDIPHVTGVEATELAMLAGVTQGPDPEIAGDRTHSTLLLANELSFQYRRDTVTLYGNVVHATHGETRRAALGSGDAGQALQAMALRQSPLTYLSAATPAGAESTLEVRVNDLLWHEVESLAGLGPKDRRYVTRTDDEDQTTILFGDGRSGARLPTGRENVLGVYRTGIGAPGNVDADQITLLSTRPLGVKSVVNPQPATGGANREDRDTARRNAPMAVMALDRLVSPQDYEDFARTFAGIGKAGSALLSNGRRQVVHLTIAGSDDIPIAIDSDLYRNLRKALQQYGDPFQGLQVALRKLKLLILSARVKLEPDFLWEAVEPKLRAALLDTFSFARRELAQDALSSEAVAAIQSQAGVVWADLDVFDAVRESDTPDELARLASPSLHHRIRAEKALPAAGAGILPAELVYLSAAVPDTLILTELE